MLTRCADGTARLWDGTSGKLIGAFPHDGYVKSGVFSPDGRAILTNASGHVQLWDCASGKLTGALPDFGTHYCGAAFSPDGTRFLIASSDEARLWNLASKKLIATFKLEGSTLVYSAAFSPTGDRILVAAHDGARLLDSASGQLLATFENRNPVTSAVFSPDGGRILTANWSNARLFDAGSQKLMATFEHEGRAVNSAVFSPDGARILTACEDKAARLWDCASGKLMTTFQHEDSVNSAVFSPDGARILTASADKTGRLWESASGKQIAIFQSDDSVPCAAFSPDGARILTTSDHGTVRIWDTGTARSLARLIAEHSSNENSSDNADTSVLRQVGQLSELASALEISEDGTLTAIPSERRSELMSQMLASAKDDQLLGPFIRWFCTPIEEQTIFPNGKMDNGTWIDNQILTIPLVSESFATEAFETFPGRPLPQIAMAAFTPDSAGANFLRSLGLERLPKDCGICTKAGEMLRNQRQPERALVAANKALTANNTSLPAHRLRAACLWEVHRSDEASQEYQVILARPDADSYDFAEAGYLAALMDRKDACESIFAQGTSRFPKDVELYLRKGWALMRLNQSTEAVDAFDTCEQLLPAGEKASGFLLLGQVAANWTAGARDRAVAAYVRLIKESDKDINWADATAGAIDAVKQPLLDALAETLRQHPELVPDKKNSGH